MIELFISENKSYDPVRFFKNRVRVFVDRNYDYGLWIDEDRLFNLLTVEQKKQYLTDRTPQGMYYQLDPRVAQEVVKLGHSPYAKQKIKVKA
jgi:hypothetical protein